MPDAPTPLDLDAIREVEVQRILIDALREAVRILQAARPAPAWDEEAVGPLQALAVQWDARAAYNADQGGEFRKGMAVKGRQCADDLRRALAAVREHAPIKPDRETAARAIFDAEFPDIAEAERDAEWGIIASADHDTAWHRQADAMLDLWPGRSEAEVKAEALRDAAEEIDRLYFGPDQDRPFSTGARHKWGAMQAAESLRARADRLEVHS